MKKLFLFAAICLMALSMSMNAQRCAVLEFRAGAGISQSDVDGISAIFITYFRPEGYTMVERTQIDRVIDEQGFQRSRLTESQMVRIGEILNVSKIVVGDVNVVMGQYNVDARVINVESGTMVAAKGATFNGSSYRASMQSLAQSLASSIAITSGGTVTAQSSGNSHRRSTVEVIYGYLKIFPIEIGEFDAEPTNVIRQINNQAQYGYNNWRIPSNEELALIRANGYIGQNRYMTKESRQGMVLLVTDGEDATTLRAEADAARKEEERQRAAEEQKKARLEAQGYVDLGLPSGTWWQKEREDGFYSYEEAQTKFGNNLPTNEQFQELLDNCTWTWNGHGYDVKGTNGCIISFPAVGYYRYDGLNIGGNYYSMYLTSTPMKIIGSTYAHEEIPLFYVAYKKEDIRILWSRLSNYSGCYLCVRLVKSLY